MECSQGHVMTNKRKEALNELTKQAQELDMGYESRSEAKRLCIQGSCRRESILKLQYEKALGVIALASKENRELQQKLDIAIEALYHTVKYSIKSSVRGYADNALKQRGESDE